MAQTKPNDPTTPDTGQPEPQATPAPPALRGLSKDDRELLQTLPARYQPGGQYCPGGATGALLLAEACLVYGIDPRPVKPVQLPTDSWQFYPGEELDPERYPDRIVLVTAGGFKLAHPMDDATEAKLREVFRAYTIDKATNQRKILPLPEDLTLPSECVDGYPRSKDHVYPGGYIKSGGRSEADRRESQRKVAARAKAGR